MKRESYLVSFFNGDEAVYRTRVPLKVQLGDPYDTLKIFEAAMGDAIEAVGMKQISKELIEKMTRLSIEYPLGVFDFYSDTDIAALRAEVAVKNKVSLAPESFIDIAPYGGFTGRRIEGEHAFTIQIAELNDVDFARVKEIVGALQSPSSPLDLVRGFDDYSYWVTVSPDHSETAQTMRKKGLSVEDGRHIFQGSSYKKIPAVVCELMEIAKRHQRPDPIRELYQLRPRP